MLSSSSSLPIRRVMTPGRRVIPILFLLAVALCACLAPSQAKVFEQIRVPVGPDTDRSALFYHPDLELMGDDDGALILLSTPELTAGLRSRGFEVEVMIADLQAHYVERCARTRDYGVWHTYDETVTEMLDLHAEFPELTTAPMSIGTTGEGRTVWAMKVSDNPGVQEDEPEVLFDGVHHAREIMAVEICLHFARYLCENYGQDPVITFLVDQRQIWFVPIVNADGFVYNELIAPYGGGMWRKNRRDNGIPGCEGVDPNRNYPYQWGGQGSSGDPCSETYRGPSAGSEPEIAALMDFINDHQFTVWQSYHSVAGMILYPWGYTTTPVPEADIFQATCEEMARDSGYEVGQCSHILYTVSGGAFDWGYGATGEHDQIFAVTTEVGGSGFWPDPSERDGLIEENLYSNIYLSLVAGAYVELVDLAVTSPGNLDPGETGELTLTVRNPGLLQPVTNLHATLVCHDPYVALQTAQIAIGDLAAGETVTLSQTPFVISVDPACPDPRPVDLTVRFEADGELVVDDGASILIGRETLIYGCDFELATHGWTQDPTHTASTGAFVRIDPVPTSYQPGDDTTPDPGIYGWITGQNPGGGVGTDDVDNGISATRSPEIDLSAFGHVQLDLNYFHGQRDAGDDPGDFFRIDVSNDGGASYPVNLVFVGDEQHSAPWRNLRVDLEDLLPLTDQMVLRVQACDEAGEGDIVEAGLDDVYIFDRGDGNDPPSAPALVSPPDGDAGQTATPTLVVANAGDPQGDPLTYGFQVFADPQLTQLVVEVAGIPEGGGGQTSWTVTPPLAANQTYYWRAFAADPQARGLCPSAWSFTVTDLAGIGGELAAGGRSALIAGPNPARGAVTIRYHSPSAPLARLAIIDVSGRRVRTLSGECWRAGWHEVHWDGRDDDGQALPGGLYWVKLSLPDETRTVRLVRLP